MDNQKTNYYKKSLDELEAIQGRPTLLLHSCCGPCATFPLRFLSDFFDVTILFNNSNIFPEAEYDRRLFELKRFVGEFNKEFNRVVKIVERPYDNEAYNKDLEPFADQPEGLQRCRICYAKRMEDAFAYAEEHGFAWFTTVMTISRQKDSQVLNEIGAQLQKKHQKTRYFYSDFKKNKGIDIAREMRIKYNLYNQLYCGCKYTYAKGLAKEKEKQKSDINEG